MAPLPDNKPEDHYLYEITVRTGGRAGAGTVSNVFINIKGKFCFHHVSSNLPFWRSVLLWCEFDTKIMIGCNTCSRVVTCSSHFIITNFFWNKIH